MTEVWTRLEPARLEAVLAAAEGQRIVVVGDLMLDRYLWGRVTRISPEAPVPVVEVESETLRLGGAANVAQNVQAFSARPVLVGVVGDDSVGRSLRRSLEEASLPVDGLVSDPGRTTTLKTRIVARGQHVVRADQEDRAEIAGRTEEQVWERLHAGLEAAAAVIISDYGKGVVTRRLLERLLPEAKSRDIPVCVDPKDTHFYAYNGVAVITPNQHEAAEVLGYKLAGDEALDRAGRELLHRLFPDTVLITRGEHGMSLFEQGGRRTDFPVVARRVYDVTGAGDTVVSTYAVALCGGAEAREAALIATHAAGLVVAEVGAAVPALSALRASFREEA
jgi:D-beta-D-heptose 7-phosphate kinase/D-beta-D-heptose 1-phosphate adenosyltransferase